MRSQCTHVTALLGAQKKKKSRQERYRVFFCLLWVLPNLPSQSPQFDKPIVGKDPKRGQVHQWGRPPLHTPMRGTPVGRDVCPN